MSSWSLFGLSNRYSELLLLDVFALGENQLTANTTCQPIYPHQLNLWQLNVQCLINSNTYTYLIKYINEIKFTYCYISPAFFTHSQ